MIIVYYSQDARLIFTSWRPLSGLSVLYLPFKLTCTKKKKPT